MAHEAAPAPRRTGPAAGGRSARIAGLVLAVALAAACSAPPEREPEPEAAAGGQAAGTTALQAPSEGTVADPEPLVTAEPDEFSMVGDLVEGFPIDLLPVPGDAVILVTSAVPVGDAAVQEVSLNLRTSATADELLTLYRDALTAAGFTEVTAETADTDLVAEVTFVRSGGDEVVSIGVLDVDGARTVTIGGRVRTAE